MIGRTAVLACTIVGFAACGGGGAGGSAQPPGQAESSAHEGVELTLRTSDGKLLFVGDLRGRPVLLFLFATFDGVSQAALRPLTRFVSANPNTHVVGIAQQPDPKLLIEAYVHALSPPFPVTYDPEEGIAAGETPIGEVDRIPTFVMLDALGRIVDRHDGYASERTLHHMLDRAREAVPEEAAEQLRGPPPALGN
ncbi:MAG: TlpA family protein disulfide reductase [Myxococcota bacterium]